jgi:hypothetical protein
MPSRVLGGVGSGASHRRRLRRRAPDFVRNVTLGRFLAGLSPDFARRRDYSRRISAPTTTCCGAAVPLGVCSGLQKCIDASQGAVVGVLGAWGAGKTSFVNLARAEFSRQAVTVLDFNPWMFSGSEQLVESFFIELAAPGLGITRARSVQCCRCSCTCGSTCRNTFGVIVRMLVAGGVPFLLRAARITRAPRPSR